MDACDFLTFGSPSLTTHPCWGTSPHESVLPKVKEVTHFSTHSLRPGHVGRWIHLFETPT